MKILWKMSPEIRSSFYCIVICDSFMLCLTSCRNIVFCPRKKKNLGSIISTSVIIVSPDTLVTLIYNWIIYILYLLFWLLFVLFIHDAGVNHMSDTYGIIASPLIVVISVTYFHLFMPLYSSFIGGNEVQHDFQG
jgi:hypothetical protein